MKGVYIKIRIIGTSSTSHINKYMKIRRKVDNFVFRHIDGKIILFDKNNNKLEIFNSHPTFKQTIEVWEAFGLIKFINNKYILNASYNYEDIINVIKTNLLIISNDLIIQITKNSKMLLVDNCISNLKEKDIVNLNLHQTKGNLNIKKLIRETSKIEVDLSNDKWFLSKLRKVLYEQINKEL